MFCVAVLATSDQFHGLSAFARPRKSTLQNYGLFAFFNSITQRYLLPISIHINVMDFVIIKKNIAQSSQKSSNTFVWVMSDIWHTIQEVFKQTT